MPTSATDCSASPRRANAGPEIIGDTAVTCGSVSSTSTTCCQLLMERRRWARWLSSSNCTVPGAGGRMRLRSCGGSTRMCDWVPRVRSMMLSCRPLIKAVRKTITATPTETPIRISALCALPSRRNFMAMVHSVHIVSIEPYRQFPARGGIIGLGSELVGRQGAHAVPLCEGVWRIHQNQVAGPQALSDFRQRKAATAKLDFAPHGAAIDNQPQYGTVAV